MFGSCSNQGDGETWTLRLAQSEALKINKIITSKYSKYLQTGKKNLNFFHQLSCVHYAPFYKNLWHTDIVDIGPLFQLHISDHKLRHLQILCNIHYITCGISWIPLVINISGLITIYKTQTMLVSQENMEDQARETKKWWYLHDSSITVHVCTSCGNIWRLSLQAIVTVSLMRGMHLLVINA